MAYAEKLVKSWRACWYVPGKKTPEKLSGFATRKEALDYATEQEVEAKRRGRARSDASQLLVRDWAEEWYSSLDLEPATLRGYRSTLTNHIIRQWGEWKLRDLAGADHAIAAWKRDLLRDYAEGTVHGIMGKLFTLLGDAVDQGLIHRNPAATKRRRGKIAPKRQQRRKDRYEHVTDPLGAFRIAERAAHLSGRDDEFVLLMAKYWLGLRWGEAIGLTSECVNTHFTLDRQLYEHPGKRFYWKEPKAGSQRRIDVPPFLADLLDHQAQHGERAEAKGRWCPCGEGLPQEYRHAPGFHLFSGVGGELHQKANPFRALIFHPAAQGLYYAGTKQEAPVHLLDADDPWSVAPTGKGVRRPKDPAGTWEPICEGMKPHGLRHSHRMLLEDLGTAKVLMDERMGHTDGSVSARYSHVTPSMRRRLLEGLQERWEECVQERRAMDLESPVSLVKGILEGDSRSTPDSRPRLQEAGRGRVA